MAIIASLCLHAALAATLVRLPVPERTDRSQTAINIVAVPTGATDHADSARHLEPAELGKRAAKVAGDSAVSAPASRPDRETLNAATVKVQVNATRPGRTLVATEVGNRRAVAAAPVASARTLVGNTPNVATSSATAQQLSAVEAPTDAVSLRPSAGGTSPTPARHAKAAPTARNATTATAAAQSATPSPAASSSSPQIVSPYAQAEARPIGGADTSAPAQQAAPANLRLIPSSSPAAPTIAAPVQPRSGSASTAPVAPTPGGIEPASPKTASPAIAGSGNAVAALMPRTQSRLAPPVEEPDPREKLLDYLALREGEGCLLALASAHDNPSLGVDGYSGSPEDLRRLGEELVRLTGVAVEVRAHAVTRDQCGVLSFARRLANYPVPGLDIRPDARTIDSGAYFSGRIVNLKRRMLYLLLVDDEGKVEEIEDLFQDSAGTIGFRAPMTLEHGPVETAQILVALARDEPLETIAARDGDHADAYFAALAAEIARTGGAIDFGFTFFFVR